MHNPESYIVSRGSSLSGIILLKSSNTQDVFDFVKSLDAFIQEISFVNDQPALEWLFDHRHLND